MISVGARAHPTCRVGRRRRCRYSDGGSRDKLPTCVAAARHSVRRPAVAVFNDAGRSLAVATHRRRRRNGRNRRAPPFGRRLLPLAYAAVERVPQASVLSVARAFGTYIRSPRINYSVYRCIHGRVDCDS